MSMRKTNINLAILYYRSYYLTERTSSAVYNPIKYAILGRFRTGYVHYVRMGFLQININKLP